MDAAIKFYDALFEDTELNQVLANGRITLWHCEAFAFPVAIPLMKNLQLTEMEP